MIFTMAGRVWMLVVTLCVFIKILHFSTAQTTQTQCAPGRYGDNCTETCGSCADPDDCDNMTGSCPSCKTGFSGPLCKGCSPFYWGSNCSPCGTGCINACDASNGTCTCQDGWTGSHCTGCSPFHWGSNCSPCGTGCMDTCDASSGTCTCKDGWIGSHCTECAQGRYGLHCTETCGSCADPYDCDNVTGRCPSCKTGFSGPLCKGCSPFYWGSNCSPCGTGCMSTCDASTGTCTCREGWTGSHCTECAVGRYGTNCTETCGSCADPHECDNVTGRCLSCKTGFSGQLCKDCAVGYWGDSCTHLCGRGCQDGVCDVVHGTCQCKRGWEMPICQDCSDGHYDVSNDCQNTCGEGCNNTCSRTDGTCQCQPGWQPPLCQWCADGWFGSECTKCGHCANNSVCDKKTGVCPFCDGDFVTPLCLDAVTPCKDSYSMAGPVVGAAIGCSIVFFIVGAIFGKRLRRSRSNQPSQADYSHEGFSTKSNQDTSELSLQRLAERPGRPESPKDRSEDTSEYGNIGFNSDVYEESVVSDNKNTAYTPLHFPVNSENTDRSDYINASVRSKTAGRGKPTKI